MTDTSGYEFEFTVTIQYMNGSATGKSCSVTCTSLIVSGTLHNNVPSHVFDSRYCDGDWV